MKVFLLSWANFRNLLNIPDVLLTHAADAYLIAFPETVHNTQSKL